MDIVKKIAAELEIRPQQVEAVIKLIDEGNTIPFIARYRKEAHGSLNDEQLRNLSERLTYLRTLEEKKEQVLATIEEQGKLTDDLKAQILAAETQVLVEDLYRPYRPKRRTRAIIAKEKGLEPLAQIILAQEVTESLETIAEQYVSEEKEVKDVADAIAGARDIIAEQISDNADYRKYIRDITREEGILTSTAKDEKAQSVYEMYYEYQEPVKKIAGHRVLALNRGEKEKFLVVKLEAPEERILTYLCKKTITEENEIVTPVLEEAVTDSYKRLIAPAIEREIRNELTEQAEDGAIKVFGKNLEQLLMQPPIAGKTVLGWDPAFRTGCKLAVVDPTGKVLDTKVIYPTAPQNKVEEAKREVKKLIQKSGLPFEVIGEAHNGVTTLEDIKTLKPDVLFTDIRMPGLSGLEVMSYISEHQFATKVVLISGYAEFEYARQAMLCGAFDYLLKPIQQETLNKTLSRLQSELEPAAFTTPAAAAENTMITDFSAAGSSLFKKILAYIQEHDTEELSLTALAEMYNISSSRLSTLIKKELGLSFSEYITARRMQKAKELLKDDSRSIEEIANAVGYHDYFYFTKVFKKTQGISPSKYRKSL